MIWLTRVAVVLWAAATLGVVIAAIISTIRSPLSHKWRYVLLSLVGVFRLSLDWASGTLAVDWFIFTLIGVALRFGEGTVLLGVSLPAGAMLTLQKVNTARADAEEP